MAGASLLTDSAGFLRKLISDGSVWRFAADVDEAGNFRIVNVHGEEWLVRTADDVERVLRELPAQSTRSPVSGAANKNVNGGSAVSTKLEVYVTDEVLWNVRRAFAKMPSDVRCYVIHKGTAPY